MNIGTLTAVCCAVAISCYGIAELHKNTEHPCPRLIGSCLDLASPTKGRILAAFTAACLQTHLASKQEKRVVIPVITTNNNYNICRSVES